MVLGNYPLAWLWGCVDCSTGALGYLRAFAISTPIDWLQET